MTDVCGGWLIVGIAVGAGLASLVICGVLGGVSLANRRRR